ncbi:MAG: phosphoribosylformylglycinamidine synthase subunit PurL [Firmicutes bacterium]|nr:phosphoribosylformylglycinamidine synthase subunit PurL [Alicyclobacillaceae bacterium]MCL6497912.1 phosphoribosylformylglycinamidine synthase subunit PurL [Bacillota bacterium]
MGPQDVGLTEAEYEAVCERLGRAPNPLELGLFGALWSEHCSYKSSKSALATLPQRGPAVVAGPGGNAGVVRLWDDWLLAFKVESHNHPSYVEPVQGAATGVGGIIRDVVAMGARPIALMDSLRFGPEPASERLLDGVVEGVGNYGNSIGVPTVGGEVYFGAGYAGNPLVNVLCAGLVREASLMSSAGARSGSRVYLVGQPTGRDGIHGASLLASQDFSEHPEAVESMRPTVQVGDPFTGKRLMEATLAAIATGWVQAVQDLGAAGLTSASAEVAYRSHCGMELDLDRVPLREASMTPYEIMLSETQERMLLVVPEAGAAVVADAVRRWDLELIPVGRVVDEDILRLRWHGAVVAEVAASALAGGCPVRTVPEDARWPRPAPALALEEPAFQPEWLPQVLAHPDVRDREYIYRRYDWMIQTRTVWGPDHDVAVLCLHEAPVGVTLALSGPGRWAAADAWAGGAGAVARAIGAVLLQDSEPLGLTDGINCGNPNRPAVWREFLDLVGGIRDAATAFAVPVTGGNVSFHNETEGRAIWPTAVIGAVGRHDHPTRPWPDRVPEAGWRLVLVNPPTVPGLGGSVWAYMRGNLGAYPRPDLTVIPQRLRRLRALLARLPEGAFCVRTVGDGGLAAALVKMLGPEGPGAAIALEPQALVGRLFSEVAGQALVAIRPGAWRAFQAGAEAAAVAYLELGETWPDPVLSLQAGTQGWSWSLAALWAAYRSRVQAPRPSHS